MAYADTLAKMIARSGLTLQQIAIKCKSYGVEITNSYISKLQSGKQAPPTDKVSEALAKACGGDPELLLYEGYLAKAPNFVRELLTGLANFARKSTKSLTLPQLPAPMAVMFEQQLDQISDVVLVKQFLDLDALSHIDQTTILKDFEDNDVKIVANPSMGLPMPDTSMEPIIPVGSHLTIMDAVNLSNGDIVVSTTDDNSYIVRRFLRTEDLVLLVPEAKNYEPIVVSHSESRIIAKVKSAVIDL